MRQKKTRLRRAFRLMLNALLEAFRPSPGGHAKGCAAPAPPAEMNALGHDPSLWRSVAPRQAAPRHSRESGNPASYLHSFAAFLLFAPSREITFCPLEREVVEQEEKRDSRFRGNDEEGRSGRQQILGADRPGIHIRHPLQLPAQRKHVLALDHAKHVLQARHHEIALLEAVGAVVGGEHAPEVEGEPVRLGAFQREAALAEA